jgi:phosphohistidine swiveling domain-containing protein
MLTLEKVRLKLWLYVDTREMPLLFVTIVLESFKKTFPKLGLEGFGMYYINSTFLCYEDGILRTYRDRELLQRCSLLLKKRLSVKLFESVKKRIEQTQRPMPLGDGEQCYRDLSSLLIDFFTLQAFPLIAERSLVFLGEHKCIHKYKDLLVQIRRQSHEYELQLEERLQQFLSAEKRKGTDFSLYTHSEVLASFKRQMKIRRKNCFIISNANRDPPYLIEPYRIALARFLEESTRKQGSLRGMPVSRGKAKGIVFVVRRKCDVKRVPDGAIVVARVLEMDDLQLVRKKHVRAIITEEGGITTHIAIVGRELNVPIITGISGVVDSLKNGDLIQVNTETGMIEKGS